ncbi:conserved hypothetical protein [Rubrivivax sp. A210]|uniref:hypothetical protein n=1 Tax=Rubrivivax sp. A210 TaxID=2772301 RepID=UPI001918A678|nr:hypothetical protein [Rubrivivax sp. A210]CAD5370249.1 conserved hypothetical protein [Rubrivivax sp. A210]
MTTMTVTVPDKTRMPYGAWLAAAAFSRLLQVFEVSRRARAERRQRNQLETDCAGVRSYAQQMMEIDPRFASELFAAADRAEQTAQSQR